MEVTDILEPLSSGQQDQAFISKGYDATSHFETEMDDVLQLYTRITGKQLDLEVGTHPLAGTALPTTDFAGMFHSRMSKQKAAKHQYEHPSSSCLPMHEADNACN